MNQTSEQFIHEEDTENSPHPVPGWIKFGGAGLAVLVIIIIWFSLSGGQQATQQTLADIESSPKPLPNPDKNTVTTGLPGKLDAETGNAPMLKIQAIEDAVTQEELDQALTPHSNKLKHIENRLETTITDIAKDQKRQDERLQSLEQKFEKIEKLIESIQKRTDAILARAKPAGKTNNKQVSKTRRKYYPTVTPLKLVSVDQWGNDYYAIIRYQGQLHELMRGQTLAGWRIEMIDIYRGSVTVKNSAGRRKELSLQS